MSEVRVNRLPPHFTHFTYSTFYKKKPIPTIGMGFFYVDRN